MSASRGQAEEQPDFTSEDFYADVASVLEDALERQPQRQDLRFKLLEVYAAQGRREPFVATAHEYRKHQREGGYGDWEKVVALGRALFVEQGQIDGSSGKNKTDGEPGRKRLGDRPGDEPLNDALAELADSYAALHRDAQFLAEVDRKVALITGHPPAPLYHASRLGRQNGGARIYLAREEPHDVLAYKLANALGQGLVAQHLGRRRLIAASTSGQQGVAAAMAAANLGLQCTVYMRAEEARSQASRSDLIRQLGAEIKTLPEDRKTPFIRDEQQYAQVLNTVRDAALKDWLDNRATALFVNGLAAGPEPYPTMLRDFHAGTGRDVRQRLVAEHRKLPAAAVAVLDGSLDPLNFFHPFLAYRSTRLIGVESEEMRAHERRRQRNRFQDARSLFFSENQVAAADVILHAQGFPSTRREHAWLRETGRVTYVESAYAQAERAVAALARTEGLLVNDASGHALAHGMQFASSLEPDEAVVILIEHIDESRPSALA